MALLKYSSLESIHFGCSKANERLRHDTTKRRIFLEFESDKGNLHSY